MVDENLIAEAKRRYPPGTIFTPAHIKTIHHYTVIDNSYYNSICGTIEVDVIEKDFWSPLIYDDGKWATIIYSPQLKEISKYEIY